jgi:tRNA-dihydrouridine synthase 3
VVIDASRLGDPDYDVAQAVEETANSTNGNTEMSVEETVSKRTGEQNSEAAKDTPDVPMRFSEKKRLNWKGKSYLAPLTTVGNIVRVHSPKTFPL